MVLAIQGADGPEWPEWRRWIVWIAGASVVSAAVWWLVKRDVVETAIAAGIPWVVALGCLGITLLWSVVTVPLVLLTDWIVGKMKTKDTDGVEGSTSPGGTVMAKRTTIEEEDLGWIVGSHVVKIDFCSESGLWCLRFSCGGWCQEISMWRLLNLREGGIAACSGDHGHRFGLPAPLDEREELRRLLDNVCITGASISRGSHDLTLVFGDGLVLEILVGSWGYDCWQLRSPTRHCVEANGQVLKAWEDPP